jgi:hypothetical protein
VASQFDPKRALAQCPHALSKEAPLREPAAASDIRKSSTSREAEAARFGALRIDVGGQLDAVVTMP